MITEEDKLDFESLPEFIREPKPVREPYVGKSAAAQPRPSTASAIASGAAAAGTAAAIAGSAAVAVATRIAAAAASKPATAQVKAEPLSSAAKHAELETLWPGVGHDVFHAAPRRSGTGYFTSGFVVGVVVTLVLGCACQFASHLVASAPPSKEIVIAQSKAVKAADGTAALSGEPGAIVPLVAVYPVASGDTLAGIALKNYHRATPRLLDEICKANDISNANVLSLGQKLKLPEYHPQSRQIATGVNQILQ